MKILLAWSGAITVTSLVALSAVPANAQFGGLGGLMGGSKSGAPSTMSADDLGKNLSSLNLRFGKAMQEMLRAQGYTIAALGDKAEADKLSSEADSLEGKDDINTVSRSISMSEDCSKEIDSKTSSSGALDAQSKALLASAVPHYALGMVQAAQLPVEYQRWVTNAQATVNGMSSNPMSAIGGAGLAGRLKDVIEVTAHLPDLISTWSSTTNNFAKFAKGNKVDTSGLSGKI
jgi:hypothetical protein